MKLLEMKNKEEIMILLLNFYNDNKDYSEIDIKKIVLENEILQEIPFEEVLEVLDKIKILDIKNKEEFDDELDFEEKEENDFEITPSKKKTFNDFKESLNSLKGVNFKDIDYREILLVIYNFMILGVKTITPYIKKMLKFILKSLGKVWKHIINLKPDMNKRVIEYKKTVQKELDSANKIISQRKASEEILKSAEKTISNLKYGSGIIPMVSISDKINFGLKSMVFHDVKMTIFYIAVNITMLFFSAKTQNYRYYTPFIIWFNLLFALIYPYFSFKNMEKFVAENGLQEFMWKEFDSVVGIKTEFYKVINKVQSPISRERMTTEDREKVITENIGEEKESRIENPKHKEWEEIFNQFFKNHVFKCPEYCKFETTEVHVFNIPTISVADFLGKREQIENFIGFKIYKIHKEYDESIGKIGIEFETEELPRIIPYNQVPKCKDTEIILGKSIKEWISWELNTTPHALVVGATGGGKSVTMNFLISEVVKKKWLPYFVDFKGGVEFNLYKDKNYTVITEREEFVEFTNGLYGEVEYRSRMFAEYRVKNLKAINQKLSKEGKTLLPRIVVFLDEYADVNSIKDENTDLINSNIGRVLAKGRAVGVHMLIGTQRPDADTIGSGAFRDNIACRIVGKMNSENAWAMSFGTKNLLAEDRVYVNKVPDDDRFKGMFIVQGTGTINYKEIIRVPFMDDDKFEEMVLNEWGNNPYEDYKLHTIETEHNLPTIDTNGNNLDDMEVPKLPSSKFASEKIIDYEKFGIK